MSAETPPTESTLPDLVPVRRALLSVSDKRGIVEFARGLHELGIELISTGGTAKALEDAGLPVIRVEEVTGAPEMLDGRVKTLHPKIHAGILAQRTPEHLKQLEAEGITPIDLVCVNLYPFEQTIAKEGVTEEEAIEQIDIGGPAMLRAAAKNYAWVTVVSDPSAYECTLVELRGLKSHSYLKARRALSRSTFQQSAGYDSAIASYMARDIGESGRAPHFVDLKLSLRNWLRYGENPHQRASLNLKMSGAFAIGELTTSWGQISGKELSYNNFLDASAALESVIDLARAMPSLCHAAVVKHTNPCGMGSASKIDGAMRLALDGDPMAAFGGILASSYSITNDVAQTIVDTAKFLEVVFAPWYAEDAQQILSAKWPNVRLLEIGEVDLSAPPHSPRRTIRSILGGVLIQDADEHIPDPATWQHRAGPKPTDEQLRVGVLAVIASKHLTSNAISIAALNDNDPMLVGGGAGQMDRVASCKIAIEKAGPRAQGAVAASDAFFPFDDGPKLLIDAGVTCIIHPGGSKRDDDTFKLCEARGVTCITTGIRHFRH